MPRGGGTGDTTRRAADTHVARDARTERHAWRPTPPTPMAPSPSATSSSRSGAFTHGRGRGEGATAEPACAEVRELCDAREAHMQTVIKEMVKRVEKADKKAIAAAQGQEEHRKRSRRRRGEAGGGGTSHRDGGEAQSLEGEAEPARATLNERSHGGRRGRGAARSTNSACTRTSPRSRGTTRRRTASREDQRARGQGPASHRLRRAGPVEYELANELQHDRLRDEKKARPCHRVRAKIRNDETRESRRRRVEFFCEK